MTIPDFSVSRRRLIASAAAAIVGGSGACRGSMRNLLLRQRSTINVTERGASLAGLRAALREASFDAGCVVRLGNRAFSIDTAELATAGSIIVPRDTTIEGENARLVFVGDAIAPPLLVGRDVSHVTLRNLTAFGNNRAIADTRSGAFASFELSAASPDDVADIRLENIRLEQFRGERWVQFLQRNASRRMSGLRIVDLRATGGSSLRPADIGTASAPLWIYGVEGEIDDIEVTRPVVDASGLKSGVVLFHKVRGATITAATILDAGLRGATDDAGAYALMAYADRGEMSDITVMAPVIRRPRSAGVYLRGVDRVRVVDATISGQIDAVNTNLPKGGIVLNGASTVTVEGGRLGDNICDLSVADGGLETLSLVVTRLRTTGSRTSVLLAVSPGKAPVAGVRLLNCDLSASSRVFRVLNEQVVGRYYNDVWLSGGTFRSTTAANVIEFTQGQITRATGYRVEDVTVQANNVAIMASGLQGSLTIRRTTIEGFGTLTYGIAADDCPSLDWDAVTFRNMPTGYAYSARSLRKVARGSLRSLSFTAVANHMARGSLTNAP